MIPNVQSFIYELQFLQKIGKDGQVLRKMYRDMHRGMLYVVSTCNVEVINN